MNIDRGTVIPALITPYNDNGSINHKALEQLIDALIGEGIKAFYVSGSTGEAFLQTPEERKAIIETVTGHTAGRAHVMFHAGAISTEQACDMAKFAAECGIDEVSSLAPFYYKFTSKEILAYYRAVMDACDKPMVIYNIPFLTGVSMLETVPELFTDPRVSGVKHTTSNFYELRLLRQRFPELTLYSGFDEQAMAGLSMGADGLIGSTYNYQAETFIKLDEAVKAGKNDEALALQDKANVSIGKILEHGIYNSVRYLVQKKYGINTGTSRAPFQPLSEEAKKDLDTLSV